MQKEKWWKEMWSEWGKKPIFYLAVSLTAGALISGLIGYHLVSKWNIFSIFFGIIATFSWMFYKNKKIARLVCIGLVALSLVACALIVIVLAGAFEIKSSGEAASWVQAAGSIGAIMAAVFIGYMSVEAAANNQLEQKKSERQHLEDGYKMVVKSLFARSISAITAIERCETPNDLNSRWNFFLRDGLMTSLKAFNQLPLHDLGNPERIRAAVVLETHILYLIGRTKHTIEYHTKPAALNHLKYKTIATIKDDINKAMERFLATYS
ncbi:hypothetical protein ACLO87_09835 [Paenalcaligenes sp. Me52]|uniref:hypothetical protein n=1 Tax=Paenalcaligenes sp. Me52 TaxID=3392038 RepID=UPI003D29ED0A